MGSTQNDYTKPYSIRLSTNASKEINDIVNYIAFIKQQPRNAIKVGDALFGVIDRIQKNPFAFRECEEIPSPTKKYRKAVCLSWLIIYNVDQFEIIILGVLYASRRSSRIKKLRTIH